MHTNLPQEPNYFLQQAVGIRLGRVFVPKPFYDFLWQQLVQFLEFEEKDSEFYLDTIMNDMKGLLSDDGVDIAQRCLEHWASEGYLPYEFIKFSDVDLTYFVVTA